MANVYANANDAESGVACASPQRRQNKLAFSAASVDQGGAKSPSLSSLLALTAYQNQQLAQSWPRIRSGGTATGAEIFRKLALKCTTIKETFQKANIVGRFARPPGYDIYKEHGRMLFELLQVAIKSLNEPSSNELIELCTQYGGKHSALRGGDSGFQARMWDDFAELLVEHIARSEAVRGRRESVRAWTTLIMFIVDKMKDGYDSGLRRPVAAAASTATTATAGQQASVQAVSDDASSERANSGPYESL